MQFEKRLLEKRVLVADGAWGTELIKSGLTPGECPESWNLCFPEKVKQVAASYVKAGAEIILTQHFRRQYFQAQKIRP